MARATGEEEELPGRSSGGIGRMSHLGQEAGHGRRIIGSCGGVDEGVPGCRNDLDHEASLPCIEPRYLSVAGTGPAFGISVRVEFPEWPTLGDLGAGLSRDHND